MGLISSENPIRITDKSIIPKGVISDSIKGENHFINEIFT